MYVAYYTSYSVLVAYAQRGAYNVRTMFAAHIRKYTREPEMKINRKEDNKNNNSTMFARVYDIGVTWFYDSSATSSCPSTASTADSTSLTALVNYVIITWYTLLV